MTEIDRVWYEEADEVLVIGEALHVFERRLAEAAGIPRRLLETSDLALNSTAEAVRVRVRWVKGTRHGVPVRFPLIEEEDAT